MTTTRITIKNYFLQLDKIRMLFAILFHMVVSHTSKCNIINHKCIRYLEALFLSSEKRSVVATFEI